MDGCRQDPLLYFIINYLKLHEIIINKLVMLHKALATEPFKRLTPSCSLIRALQEIFKKNKIMRQQSIKRQRTLTVMSDENTFFSADSSQCSIW